MVKPLFVRDLNNGKYRLDYSVWLGQCRGSCLQDVVQWFVSAQGSLRGRNLIL